MEGFLEETIDTYAGNIMLVRRGAHQEKRHDIPCIMSLHFAAESIAIHDGHHAIRDDEVRYPSYQQGQCFTTVGGSLRFEAVDLKQQAEGFCDVDFVIDDQDQFHRYSAAGSFFLISAMGPSTLIP